MVKIKLDEKNSITYYFVFCNCCGMAQLKYPVQWNFAAVKKAVKLRSNFHCNYNKAWNIYSQTNTCSGPVPTKIVFKTIH